MSYEPWYQTQSPTKAEVINAVTKSDFISKLNKEENTQDENNELTDYANKLMHKLSRPTVSVTYEDLRSTWNWTELRDQIIDNEVKKEETKGFGSYRGYYTFVHNPLCDSIKVSVIHEYVIRESLKEKIKILVFKWIEKRYAPGGNGYIEAQKHFNHLSK
jgi:hypothetical protein